MKKQFGRHTDVLTELLRKKDTTQFWIVWSDIVERSFVTGLGIVDDYFLGHGIFTMTEKTMHTPKIENTSPSTQHKTWRMPAAA